MKATGIVKKAFGNLLNIEFQGEIKQGEICFIELGNIALSAEVIEINNNRAKVQVYEDTSDIQLGTHVSFSKRLLEAELGPGLLTSVFDGLQNPLEEVAKKEGLYLNRGVYIPALDREKKWDFTPTCKVNDKLKRGDSLGFVMEGRFEHKIMLPFNLRGEYTIKYIAEEGSYNIEDTVAKVVSNDKEIELSMLQRWPVKMALTEGVRIRPSEMMDTGMRIIDTQLPLLKGGTFCSPGPFGAGKTVLQHHLAKIF